MKRRNVLGDLHVVYEPLVQAGVLAASQHIRGNIHLGVARVCVELYLGLAVALALTGSVEVSEVCACTEPAARAGDHDRHHRLVLLGLGHGVLQLGRHPVGPGVQRLRAVQPDRGHRVRDLVENLLVHWNSSLGFAQADQFSCCWRMAGVPGLRR